MFRIIIHIYGKYIHIEPKLRINASHSQWCMFTLLTNQIHLNKPFNALNKSWKTTTSLSDTIGVWNIRAGNRIHLQLTTEMTTPAKSWTQRCIASAKIMLHLEIFILVPN